MDNGIGATLREARNRRKLDLSEVEAAIKIRVRFLRAIENEEWDALPGDAYARGFIRTYASYLGLDGERLAEDFGRGGPRRPVGERVPKRVEPVPSRAGNGGRRRGRGLVPVGIVALVLIGLLIGIGLIGGGDDKGGSSAGENSGQQGGGQQARQEQPATPAPQPGVAVSLLATDEVWVCLLDAGEEPLVAGEILEAGGEAGPFRSRGFELALGNGSVELTIDGEPAEIAESSSPVGYSIGPNGDLVALEEGERPDCE